MSETLSFTELDEQHFELLPARTVLSTVIPMGGDKWCKNHSCNYSSNYTSNYAKAISINASPVIQVAAPVLSPGANITQVGLTSSYAGAFAGNR